MEIVGQNIYDTQSVTLFSIALCNTLWKAIVPEVPQENRILRVFTAGESFGQTDTIRHSQILGICFQP